MLPTKNLAFNAIANMFRWRRANEETGDVEKDVHLKNITFEYSMWPVYIFSRVFGLMPFSVARDSDGSIQKPRVKIIDLVWFLISICSCLTLAFYELQIVKLPQDPHNSQLLILGDNVIIVLGLAFNALVIVMNMLNRKRLVEILRKFTIFDQRVRLNSVS